MLTHEQGITADLIMFVIGHINDDGINIIAFQHLLVILVARNPVIYEWLQTLFT
ncbi:hypothetical protein D3C85_1941980 [compost metagenome]